MELYQLPSSSITNTAGTDKLPWTLRVSTPFGSRIADSQRVMIVNEDNRISAYKGVRWSDSASVLVRNRLTNAFRADGRLSTISRDNTDLLPDLELDGELGAFQVEYIEGKPAVIIRMYATLVQPARYKAIAANGFEVMQPVEGKGMPDVIKAFGKASDRLGGEIVGWTVEQSMALQSRAP
jgi:cholesterol transport system auxiliary component